MASYRFFISFLLFIAIVMLIAETVHAQTAIHRLPKQFREGGNDFTAMVQGNHFFYASGDNCPDHKTSTGRSFDHIHVDMSFPAEVKNEFGVVIAVVTENKVRDFFDNWAGFTAKDRENVVIWSGGGGVNLTFNCWGYSLGYDTWIQDPTPIYEDDYKPVREPTEGDVIKLGGHVITVTGINHCESPYLAVETNEKMRHSGIYYFRYDYSKGVGNDLKNFYRRK